MLSFILSATIGYGQQTTLNRISLVVSDMEQSVKWYQNTLDMSVYHEMKFPEYDSLRISFLKNDFFEMELLEKATTFSIQKYEPDYSVNDQPMVGIYKVGFKVDDLETFHHRLKRLNANITYGITTDQTFNTRWFIVADPDGNSLQFYEPL